MVLRHWVGIFSFLWFSRTLRFFIFSIRLRFILEILRLILDFSKIPLSILILCPRQKPSCQISSYSPGRLLGFFLINFDGSGNYQVVYRLRLRHLITRKRKPKLTLYRLFFENISIPWEESTTRWLGSSRWATSQHPVVASLF